MLGCWVVWRADCMSDYPYEQVIEFFQDQVVGEFVADLLDYLDYQDRVFVASRYPRRVSFSDRIQFDDGSSDNPVDLTCDEDDY